MRPQNTPRPKWPDCRDEYGFKVIIGAYRLLEYLGHGMRGDLTKAHHHYKVQCIRCEKIQVRIQNSLLRGEKAGTKGCVHCVKRRDKSRDEKKREQKVEKETAHRAEWLAIMRLWPATPLEFRQGIDDEKVWKLRKLPPKPDRWVRCLCYMRR